jgi:exodeoxyribonuclease VII large subunit
VIIIARGGGSAEDLAAFNDEQVVRAIFASRVPVISGVGHETDWTLSDLVADLRAPTPSAAAEVCTPSIVDLALRVSEARADLRHQISAILADATAANAQQMRSLRRASPAQTVTARQRELLQLTARIQRGRDATLERTRGKLALQSNLLRSLNPVRVLHRGYAAVSVATTGQAVTSRRQAPADTVLHLQLADGAVLSRVESRAATNYLPAEANQ